MSSSHTFTAPAKVNLWLHVTGKRQDGYHLLETGIVFADIGDRLSFEPASDLSLMITGPYASALSYGSTRDNLIIKACQKMEEYANKQARYAITLEKNIPVGAGIGGGSSDAAATIRFLAHSWGIEADHPDLYRIALSLGADVPVCLYGQPAWVDGIGENITSLPPLPSLPTLLINPGIPLGTVDVFKCGIPSYSPTQEHPQAEDYASFSSCISWLKKQQNDLETPAQSLCPDITTILGALQAQEGCTLARMSGSGATCLGIFNDREQAEQAKQLIKEKHPEWWGECTTLALQ